VIANSGWRTASALGLAMTAIALLLSGCPPATLVPVTDNPESACRFAMPIAENGTDSFPPFSFSPDGLDVVAAADVGAVSGREVVDASIWVYDLTHASRYRITVHGTAPGGFYHARWSPDGAIIAVATSDHVALVTPDGDHVRDLPGPFGVSLSDLAFSADGKTLAVSGNDNLLFFLVVGNGKQIDGDVFKTRIKGIEAEGNGFLVFHEQGDRLRRSYIEPGRPPVRRPDLDVKVEGVVTEIDAQDVIVHDPELGARLVVKTGEHLLLPGVRGGNADLLVDAQGFRLSADRKHLAFSKVTCGQAGCSGRLRVMQCRGLPAP
jgi:hypothetical protein